MSWRGSLGFQQGPKKKELKIKLIVSAVVVVDDTKLLGNTIAWVSRFIGFGDGAYLVHFGYGNTFPELHHEPAPKMCSYALKVDIISMTMDKPQSFNHYQHSSHG